MVKRKLLNEYTVFRKEVTWVEYAFWWAVRFILVYVLIQSIRGGSNASIILQLKAELSLSFLLPLLHLLPRKIFLARLSYRTQDIVAFMLVPTAVFGQYKGYYSTVEWYDAYLHVFGCFVCVFAGYWLMMAFKHDDLPVSPAVAVMCGVGFSFIFAVSWEIFEFICDTIWTGSNSQNWSCIDSDQLLALLPPINPRRYALLDTMTDLMAGSIGSIAGGAVIVPYVRHMNKKATKLTLINNTLVHENKAVDINELTQSGA